jgi:hypothetical protein
MINLLETHNKKRDHVQYLTHTHVLSLSHTRDVIKVSETKHEECETRWNIAVGSCTTPPPQKKKQ